MTRLRRYSLPVVAVGMIALVSCSPKAVFRAMGEFLVSEAKETDTREVHVRVVVDPDFASHSLWRSNVENLMNNASRVYKAWAGVTFTVDTMFVWDHEGSGVCNGYFLSDCLVKEIPRSGSDIVVFLTREVSRPTPIAGMSVFDQGYLYVVQPDWANNEADYQKAFHALIHELGHMFGAVHVYAVHNRLRVMNPVVTREVVKMVGKEYEYTEPDFHPGNVRILQALSGRSFGEWAREDFKAIRKAYGLVREEHDPWQVGGNGILKKFEFDVHHEGDHFVFLSLWASLCGMNDMALGYIDSLETLERAIYKTCMGNEVNRDKRMCRRCGGGGGATDLWLTWHKAYLHRLRSLAYLRAGKPDKADTYIDSFNTSLPPRVSVASREKLRNGYELYKERWPVAGAREAPAAEENTADVDTETVVLDLDAPFTPDDTLTTSVDTLQLESDEVEE